MSLASAALRVHGIADTVEESVDGTLTPVEHKLGRGAGDVWPSTVQLVAQAICLEEMTERKVDVGALFIVSERRRISVDIAAHRDDVVTLVGIARNALKSVVLAEYSARRCRSCSVEMACQPSKEGDC